MKQKKDEINEFDKLIRGEIKVQDNFVAFNALIKFEEVLYAFNQIFDLNEKDLIEFSVCYKKIRTDSVENLNKNGYFDKLFRYIVTKHAFLFVTLFYDILNYMKTILEEKQDESIFDNKK